MPESDEYRTIDGVSEGLYKEKGSRFIAVALPVTGVGEVKEHLESLRRKYHDARHHCYAYSIGEGPDEFRFNDDGEPSGTAGKPIFGQIQSFGLTNVLIVVIRYFGGVKLGTGGLIQAYRAAAKDALDNGNIVNKVWKTGLRVKFGYTQMNEVMKILKEEEVRIISQDFQNETVITFEIRKGRMDAMGKKLKMLEKVECAVI